MIGTAFLIIAVNWGAAAGPTQMSYAIGFTVTAMVQVMGFVSGGHFNPAVTIAIYINEVNQNWFINTTFMLWYITAQIVGAIFGAIISLLALNTSERTDIKTLSDLQKSKDPFT